MKTLTIMSIIVLVLTACGTAEMPSNSQNKDTTVKDLQPTELAEQSIVINGYVSPININVDGVGYSDSEDFYTSEVGRLEKLVKLQYPNYILFFDAEVGLKDFKQGLVAYMVSTGDVGVSDETPVDGRGQFKFNLPAKTDLTQNYILRAYKRIGLRLEYKDDVITWCYNFYAEKNVIIENGKSMILRDFVTKITKYQCTSTKTAGISLPSNDMPSKIVKEAFEESDTWPGYGPKPKAKTTATTPVDVPSDKKTDPTTETKPVEDSKPVVDTTATDTTTNTSEAGNITSK
jgi:hypothetical protein